MKFCTYCNMGTYDGEEGQLHDIGNGKVAHEHCHHQALVARAAAASMGAEPEPEVSAETLGLPPTAKPTPQISTLAKSEPRPELVRVIDPPAPELTLEPAGPAVDLVTFERNEARRALAEVRNAKDYLTGLEARLSKAVE